MTDFDSKLNDDDLEKSKLKEKRKYENKLITQSENLKELNINEISLPDGEIYLNEYEKDELNANNDSDTESKFGHEKSENSTTKIKKRFVSNQFQSHIIDYDDHIEERVSLSSSSDEDESTLKIPVVPFKFLIIDCSPINFIDTVGVKTISQVILKELQKNLKFF